MSVTCPEYSPAAIKAVSRAVLARAELVHYARITLLVTPAELRAMVTAFGPSGKDRGRPSQCVGMCS